MIFVYVYLNQFLKEKDPLVLIGVKKIFTTKKRRDKTAKSRNIISCNYCKNNFKPNLSNQLFCTSKCQQHQDNKKRKESRKNNLLFFDRKCADCDNIFIFQTSQPTQKYCSENCKSNVAGRKWYKNNKTKTKENKKTYYSKNKHRYVERTAKRRAIKLKATMKGFEEEIKEIYKNCPKGFHVDHVIPLQGKTVCGLHVPWNLQYLTAEENLKKSNKLLID